MKKFIRIGMLLCSFLLASVGWTKAQDGSGSIIYPEKASESSFKIQSTTGKLSSKGNLWDKCGEGSAESEISVFANGNPVRVYEADNTLYIATFDGIDVFGFTKKDSDSQFYAVRLYGGSYETDVNSNTEITLESGAIRNIYGGGRSDNPSQTANVSGTATINVTGGSFSLVCGGGRYYAKTNAVDINIGSEQTAYTGTSHYIMVGSMDQGLTSNSERLYNSTLEENVNAVNTASLDIYGGTFRMIGAGGGNGYTHTGVSTVNLTNVDVDYFYGVYSNGIADDVTVNINGGYINKGFASINRGKLGDGKFQTSGTYFRDGVKAYIGAAAGWANSDTNGDPTPVVTGNVLYRLFGYNLSEIYLGEGLADATFEVRNKLKIAKFDRGSAFSEEDRYLTNFTISEKGNWKSTIGMTFATGEDAAILTNNGKLDAGVIDNVEDLYAFVEAGANTVFLNANPNYPYTLSKQLVIKKPMTLWGLGARIEADANASWPTKQNSEGKTVTDNSKANLISIEAGPQEEVTLMDIHVKNSKAAGINVQTAKKVILTGVTSKDNATAGLLVHAPVEAYGFQTAGNVWGGVKIDKGDNGSDLNEYTPSFKFDGRSSFAEELQIWAEAGEDHIIDPKTAVTVPDDSGEDVWRQITSDDGKFYVWTNAKPNVNLSKEKIGDVTYVYANGNNVEVSAGEEGKTTITSGPDIMTFTDATDKVYLFGGSKNADVETTSISMIGGQLARIYGGGYMGNVQNAVTGIYDGTITERLVGGGLGVKEVPASVTGMAKLIVVRGNVRYLVAGGDQYATVKQAYVYSDNSTFHWALGGGFAPNDASIDLSTPYDKNGNNVESSTLEINGGQINGAICAGGGFSHAYVKTAKATFNKVVFNGGLYGAGWNGRSENVSVTAKGCTFNMKEGADPDYRTIAGMIRGIVLDSLTMSFDDQCTFAENYEAYLGCDRDNEGDPIPYAESAIWSFAGTSVPMVKVSEGMRNVTVKGAPVVVKKFLHQKSTSSWVDAFEVPIGKTWAFNNGLTFATEEGKKSTIKNYGTIQLPFYGVLPALVDGLEGTLAIEKDSPMAFIVQAMNDTQNITKSDFSNKTFTIECQDGVIASNTTVAKELLATGRIVSVLSFEDSNYKIENYTKVPAQITNLPDSVAYGTAPITLAFNQKNVEATIKEENSEVASITDGILTIKKPGDVTIKLQVKKSDTNSEYDEDLAAEQNFKVTKRIVTLTGCLVVDYGTNEETKEAPTSKVYDGSATVNVKFSADGLAFAGKLGSDATGLSLSESITGTMADANVGENKPVTVTATLTGDSAAYYELAPITFVKATVTPKPITITAEAKTVKYGEAIDYTANDYTKDLVGTDKLEGELKFSCAVSTDTLAGEYQGAITPYGLSSSNYQITYGSGDLTIQAWGPSISIIDHKIAKEGATTNIVMSAQLINNGGAEIDKVTFTYKQDNVETPVTDMTEKDGIYTVTYKNMPADTYELKVTAHNRAGHSGAAFIKVTVDEKTPQNLTWDASVRSTMVYGQEMTLSATSDQAAATGEYIYSYSTYDSGEAEFVDPSRNIIKAIKVGEFMINAKRAEDENYSPATLETIINVVQKPITVEVGEISKIYDGTTTIATPTFTVSGVETGDDVSINTENLALSFASKNAGDNIPVILPELTLTGDNAANYTLVQPKNVTGKITKAPLTIKVKDVTRPWNQRHTKYKFEATGLVNGETLAQAYTGNLNVTENGNTLELNIDATKSQNYAVTAQSGTLTITKGTPKAVVYGSGNDWKGMIVDNQGHTGLRLENEFSKNGKLNVLDANGQVLTSSINSKPTATQAASLNAASFNLRSASLRGTVSPDWNNASFTSVVYGSEAMAFSVETGFTYTSTNMSVLTVTANTSTVTVTPVGVGNATIIAESAGEVKIWNVTVTPKELGLTTTGMEKTYDGTATATGTVSLGTGVVGTDDVALDLGGITFNYDNKNVSDNKSVTPSQALVLIGTNANNYALSSNLTGKITRKQITVNDPITVYYNGQTVHTLTSYPVSGLVAGDVVPIKVTFADAAVGARSITSIALTTDNDAQNYTLPSAGEDGTRTGTIQRSTLVATLPTEASSVSNLKSNIQLAIRETGEAVTANTVSYEPTITTTGSGANTVYYVTGGDTDNYTVVYTTNQVGYGAEPENPGGGTVIEPDPITPIVSDPVIAERTGTTAVITWEKVSGATSYKLFLYAKKGDSTPLKAYEFDKNGNLKATNISFTLTELEDGKAYYVETAAYNASGVLLEKKGVELSATPTGIEAIAEGSMLYAVKGAIVIVPTSPIEVMIVSANGRPIFHDEVAGYTQVTANAGIYVVVIQKGKDRLIEKVIVK